MNEFCSLVIQRKHYNINGKSKHGQYQGLIECANHYKECASNVARKSDAKIF